MMSARRSGILLAMDILKKISCETIPRGTTIQPHSPANNSDRLAASEMKTTSKLSRSAEQNALVSTYCWFSLSKFIEEVVFFSSFLKTNLHFERCA